MTNENIEKLTTIEFPNTVSDEHNGRYTKKMGYYFKGITKNGEMAPIQWIQVWKEGKLIAEIKESVCNLYFN